MRSFRQKPVGWRNESYRHYLAAKGIKTKHEYFMAREFNLSRKALKVIPEDKQEEAIERMRAGEDVKRIVKDLAGIEDFNLREETAIRLGPKKSIDSVERAIALLMVIGEDEGRMPTITDVRDRGFSLRIFGKRFDGFGDAVERAVDSAKKSSDTPDDPDAWFNQAIRRRKKRDPLKREAPVIDPEEIARARRSADERLKRVAQEGFRRKLLRVNLKELEEEREDIVSILSQPSPGLLADVSYINERKDRLVKIDDEVVRLKSALDDK